MSNAKPANASEDNPSDDILQTYQAFPSQFGSVVLGTVSKNGQPQASYAPCVIDTERNIYIFVSGLSAHTQNLHTTGQASALFVEDESKTKQMFARKRLSYSCNARLIERESDHWNAIAQQFTERFGNIVEIMVGLPDFRIFQLCPHSGQFVMGFGAAYKVNPDNLDQLIHQKGPDKK
ncbi:MAG: pyridoxamine 5'-phosphate oxidase family protein [Cyanobacteria bacterium J06621_11]